MRKYTNDLKTVNKHKKNSKYFEHKKKRSLSLLNKVKESSIACRSYLSKGIIERKKPIVELDFLFTKSEKKANLVAIISILIPWVFTEIDHWILLVVD